MLRRGFVSPSDQVIFFILYKILAFHNDIFGDLPKISDLLPKILRICPKARQTIPNIFRRFAKIIKDVRRRSENVSIIHQSREESKKKIRFQLVTQSFIVSTLINHISNLIKFIYWTIMLYSKFAYSYLPNC